MPELVLLTHATEFDRATNTGRLVAEIAEQPPLDDVPWQVRTVLWQRKAADEALLARLADHNQCASYVLLYPTPDARLVNMDELYSPTESTQLFPDGFVLLDATWQQAQKMYNQSPYLHALPKWQIQSNQPSVYQLRRNQKQQGWCTAELVTLLWRYSGASHSATALAERFREFNQK